MSIEKLKKMIADSSKIVFFGGAGVSTESGIPDFRSETGIYNAITEFGYRPEEILSRTFFEKEPEIFFKFYKKTLMYENAMPNDAHYGLAKLEKEGRVSAVITQNIDNLHQKAGSKKVLELHGTLHRNFCVKCQKEFTTAYCLKTNDITYCDNCGGIVRPDIVLYEESLNEAVLEASVNYIEKADMLIVGGTSLNVYPAAGLIHYYKGNGLVLINQTATSYDSRANLILRDKIGSVFRQIVKEF